MKKKQPKKGEESYNVNNCCEFKNRYQNRFHERWLSCTIERDILLWKMCEYVEIVEMFMS